MTKLQTNLLQIEIDKYNDSISTIDKSLTLSKANLDLYNSSSQQYSQEQSTQIELLKQKEIAINAEIASVQNELQNDKLTISSKKLLNDELSNLNLDSATNQKSINDNSISKVSTVYEIQQKQNSELQKSLSLQLEIAKSIQPQNYNKISVIINSQISSQKTNLSQIKDSISTLISQRDILDKTSSAWQTINNQVLTYQDSLESALSTLSATYKTQLDNSNSKQLKSIESDVFDGSTEAKSKQILQDKMNYQSEYISGAEKEASILRIQNQLEQD